MADDKKADDKKATDDKKKTLRRKLETPIEAHGEKVTEIEFREPTAGDLVDNGDPVDMDFQTGAIRFNTHEMTEMMALLASVPPSSIRAMTPRDWKACAMLLLTFFLPAP
jgi:hypothetical protein